MVRVGFWRVLPVATENMLELGANAPDEFARCLFGKRYHQKLIDRKLPHEQEFDMRCSSAVFPVPADASMIVWRSAGMREKSPVWNSGA